MTMGDGKVGLKEFLIAKGIERNDEWGLLISGRLTSINDLPAEEAYYNVNCFTIFSRGFLPPEDSQNVCCKINQIIQIKSRLYVFTPSH